ncbi:MAG: TlpA family protein disulfide reductase [Methylophilaceae bacterium]
MNKKLTLAGYLILTLCFGFIVHSVFFKNQSVQTSTSTASAPSIQTLFAANFPDENGKQQNLKQWQGKIIVLNFWATWCPPCREEMPELSKLNTQYQNKNVVVIGVSTDDVPTVKKFTEETKVSYSLLAADMAGSDLAFTLGNDQDVLPYTVIIKPDGTVAKTFFGRLSMPKLEEALNNLI